MQQIHQFTVASKTDFARTEPDRLQKNVEKSPASRHNCLQQSSRQLVLPADEPPLKDGSANPYDKIPIPALFSPNNGKSFDTKNEQEFFINRSYVVSFSPKKLESNKLSSRPSSLYDLNTSETQGHRWRKYKHLIDNLADDSQQIFQSPLHLTLSPWKTTFYYLAQLALIVYLPLWLAFNYRSFSIPAFVLQVLLMSIQLLSFRDAHIADEKPSHFILLQFLRNQFFPGLVYLVIFLIELIDRTGQELLLLLVFIIFAVPQYSHAKQHFQLQYNFFTKAPLILLFLTDLSLIFNALVALWFLLVSNNNDSGLLYHSDHPYLQAATQAFGILTFNGNFNPMNDTEAVSLCIFQLLSLLLVTYICLSTSTLLTSVKEANFRALQQYFSENELNSFERQRLLDVVTAHSKVQLSELIKDNRKYTSELLGAKKRLILTEYFTGYSDLSLNQITKCTEILETSPGDLIVRQGQQDDHALYLILKGIYEVRTMHGLYLGQAHKAFGEYSFYTENPRTANVISQSPGQLLRVDLHAFKQCLIERDKELYFQTKHQILDKGAYPVQCFCCKNSNHMINSCPLLTYQPQRESIIQEHNEVLVQQAARYIRKRNSSKFNALNMVKLYQQMGSYLQQKYQDYRYLIGAIWNDSSYTSEESHYLEDLPYEEDYTNLSKQLSSQNPDGKSLCSQPLPSTIPLSPCSPKKKRTSCFGVPSSEKVCENLNGRGEAKRRSKRRSHTNSEAIPPFKSGLKLNTINEMDLDDPNSSNSSNGPQEVGYDLRKCTFNCREARINQQSDRNHSEIFFNSPSQFTALEPVQFQSDQEIVMLGELDKMHKFEFFEPQNNYDSTIFKSNKFITTLKSIQMTFRQPSNS